MPASIFNVKDYGAVSDGCHDDTAAIQSALDLLNRPTDLYKVHLWSDSLFGASPGGNVQQTLAKARASVTVPALAPGATHTQSIGMPTAVQGDLVTLGPPPTLPPTLLGAGAVVTDGKVQLRVTNLGPTATAAVTGTWMVAAGGGSLAGRPQIAATAADAAPPWTYPA